MSQPTFRRLSRPHLARIGLGSIVLAIVLTGAVNVSRTEAATVTVTCSSSPCSASLIQTAIDGASTGDTISIGAGTYQGDVLVNKSVTLQAVPGTVTIDGQNTASHLGTTVTVGPAAVVATIDGLTITGGYADTATQWGGGLRNNGTLTVRNSTITGNNGGTTEGGGIFNASTLTIIDSTITDNTSSNGGGIANYGTLVMSGSTLSNNTVPGNGGGLDNAYGAGATITNSTFYGNTASFGGGINNYATTLTLTSSTVVHNTASFGGGINNASGTTPPSIANLTADLILGNNANDLNGAAPSTSSNNMIGVPSGDTLSQIVQTDGNGIPVLANNGGPTTTVALVADSPASDQVPTAFCPATDQRGVTRPDTAESTCDIGAYEYQDTGTGGGGCSPTCGTATPELGSGELLATGVLPLLGIALYRRRRSKRTPQDGNTAA